MYVHVAYVCTSVVCMRVCRVVCGVCTCVVYAYIWHPCASVKLSEIKLYCLTNDLQYSNISIVWVTYY